MRFEVERMSYPFGEAHTFQIQAVLVAPPFPTWDACVRKFAQFTVQLGLQGSLQVKLTHL